MAEYRSLFPVRSELCSNKQFQATASLREAAPELRRWASVEEEQMLFSEELRASSKIFSGVSYPQFSGGAVVARKVDALRPNYAFQPTGPASRARG